MDERVKVVLIAEGMYIFFSQFSYQYNTLYAQALGASGSDIGLIALISALVLFTISPLIGLAIEKYSIKKMMILGLLCDVTAMIFFVLAYDWRLLIPAFILFGQVIRQIPLADVVFVTFTEPDMRATIIGLSRALWSGSIVAPLIASAVVAHYGGITAQGIRPLYYISFTILLAILIIVYTGLDESSISGNIKKGRLLREKTSLFDEYLKFLKSGKDIKKLITVRLFRDGSLFLLMTFVPLWIVNVKGATATMLGIISTLSILSGSLMQFPAGRLADKFGRKRTFFLFTMFNCVGLIVLILASRPEHLILAGILGIGIGGVVGGGIGGVSLTPLMTIWWEAVPTQSRGKLYGLEGIIMATSKILTLLGGILWDQGLGMLIMLTPVLIELIIVVPLLYTIPER